MKAKVKKLIFKLNNYLNPEHKELLILINECGNEFSELKLMIGSDKSISWWAMSRNLFKDNKILKSGIGMIGETPEDAVKKLAEKLKK